MRRAFSNFNCLLEFFSVLLLAVTAAAQLPAFPSAEGYGALSDSLALGTLPADFRFILSTNIVGQVNLIAAKPVITLTKMISTNFVFTGTGGIATSNYFVLTATNIALPLAN